MKSSFILFVCLLGLLIAALAYGAEPVTPAQSQASHLAVPTPEAMPRHVMVVVLCNNVVAAGVIDDSGGWHPTHLVSKAQLDSLLKLVPPGEDISMNLGCPTDATKDIPVL